MFQILNNWILCCHSIKAIKYIMPQLLYHFIMKCVVYIYAHTHTHTQLKN